AASPPTELKSFPTRRSSDLIVGDGWRQFTCIGDQEPGAGVESAGEAEGASHRIAALDDAGRGARQPVFGARARRQHEMDRVRSRSEEHTSELQSRVDLVCRL